MLYRKSLKIYNSIKISIMIKIYQELKLLKLQDLQGQVSSLQKRNEQFIYITSYQIFNISSLLYSLFHISNFNLLK